MSAMPSLTDLAAQSPYVVLDGAMGTMLQQAGLDDGAASESWNTDRPDDVAAIHRAYLDAGAKVITTNTFGGTRPRLELQGLGDQVHELNREGARIARETARPYGALVAGDIGPTGELLEPLGTLTADEAQAVFEEQVRGLVDGGIDLIIIETMSDLAEVEAAVRGVQAVAADLPIVVTLSFDTHLRTMMGVTPTAAVTTLAELGVTAVGANCGRGPEEMEAIMEQMAAARPEGMLLVAQSNAGLPHLVGDHFEYDAEPEKMAAHAATLRALGVDLIGACCGSTPDHLRAMSEALGS